MANEEEFDIIIVGGGTSGCVLANRLSEDPSISILVLEAGEDRSSDPKVYTPGLAGSVFLDPQFDWMFVSEPEAGIAGRRMKHPRGKVVGGTSAINSFALVYPNVEGMNAWGEGWTWEDVKKYFAKFQTVCAPAEEVKRELGVTMPEGETNGPIQASYPVRVTAWQKAWVETWRALGLANEADPMQGRALGGYTSTCHISGDRHERSHAGVAYLDPVKETRKNLKVVMGALVEKIEMRKGEDGGEAVARGVRYSLNGSSQVVLARKEVILAAGTFASPQLLELSGIGHPDVLQKHGIDIVCANPYVGENLQDHIRPGFSIEAADGLLPPRQPQPTEEARKQYENDRTGPLAESGCFAFAYSPLLPFLDGEGQRELALLLDKHLADTHPDPFVEHHRNFVREMITSPDEATATAFMVRRTLLGDDGSTKDYITLLAMLSHPLSTGSVHITSPSPTVKPAINLNYYSHPIDMAIHTRQVLALHTLAQTPPLSTFIKPAGQTLPPGHSISSLEGAEKLIREHAMTNYHPCGTCALGRVVDKRLRVFGTRNLRVVDASVMPIVPRGNIITTVYAVAEKAADLASEDLGITRTT